MKTAIIYHSSLEHLGLFKDIKYSDDYILCQAGFSELHNISKKY